MKLWSHLLGRAPLLVLEENTSPHVCSPAGVSRPWCSCHWRCGPVALGEKLSGGDKDQVLLCCCLSISSSLSAWISISRLRSPQALAWMQEPRNIGRVRPPSCGVWAWSSCWEVTLQSGLLGHHRWVGGRSSALSSEDSPDEGSLRSPPDLGGVQSLSAGSTLPPPLRCSTSAFGLREQLSS